MAPTQTDWELIQEDPQLSDYTAGFADRPELVELVNGTDVVTVFAPTNAAIAQVANWDEIVADDEAFESFVRSHLISGALTAAGLPAKRADSYGAGDTFAARLTYALGEGR